MQGGDEICEYQARNLTEESKYEDEEEEGKKDQANEEMEQFHEEVNKEENALEQTAVTQVDRKGKEYMKKALVNNLQRQDQDFS